MIQQFGVIYLRTKDQCAPIKLSYESVCNPVEVRRCRFIAIVPEVAATVALARATRFGPLPTPASREPDCERGLEVDEAIFGREDFRELLCAPDALFLIEPSIRMIGTRQGLGTNRFLITSVLRDKGRTTPCSFYKSHQSIYLNIWIMTYSTHEEQTTGIA